MQKTKFTFNAFLLIAILFSLMAFFFTVKMTDMAGERIALNEYNYIEGSEYAVSYSSLEKNGIYKGSQNTHTLIAEGRFASDWGAALCGKYIYTNEYRLSDLGLMFSDFVRVNTETGEKEILLKDALLRGKCKTGELVCVKGGFLPSLNAEENSLCRLYRMTADNHKREVLYINPENGETIAAAPYDESADFDSVYLEKTIGEVTE